MNSSLEDSVHGGAARLIIGDNLLIRWAYVQEGSLDGRLVFTACEADGTTLSVMAIVPPFAGEERIPGAVIAEVLKGSAAAARRLYPDHAQTRGATYGL